MHSRSPVFAHENPAYFLSSLDCLIISLWRLTKNLPKAAAGWPQVTVCLWGWGAGTSCGLSQHWHHVSVTFLTQNPTIYCLLLFRFLNVFKTDREALKYLSMLNSGYFVIYLKHFLHTSLPASLPTSMIYRTVVKIILNCPWHNFQLSMKAPSWSSLLNFNFEFMVWI